MSESNDEENNTPKKEKTFPFSITRMNKYFLFPFLVPIICFFTKWCSEPMKYGPDPDIIEKNGMNEDVEHTFVFVYTLINSTSHIMGGLLYFISLLKSNTKKSEDSLYESSEKSSIIKDKTNNVYTSIIDKNRDNKCRECKIVLIIFGMAFILTIYNIIKGYALNNPQLEKRLYFLFFFTLFNMFILKKQIFIHQKVSLAIAALGMGILFSLYFYYLNYAKYNVIYDILLFIGSFFYSLYLFLVKYLTNNYGMSPFLVILIIGLFSTLFTITGYLSFSFIKKRNLSYILNVLNCTEINYVCFENYYIQIIIYFIINSILQVLIFLVIYYFSPEVFAISDIISPMLSFINKCIYNKIKNKVNDPLYIVLNVLGYIIILLGAFMYNEIIVCNFCGLNKYTWKAIGLRGIDEIDGRKFSDSNTVYSYIIDRDSSVREDSVVEANNENNEQKNNIINNSNIL